MARLLSRGENFNGRSYPENFIVAADLYNQYFDQEILEKDETELLNIREK